MSCHQDIPYCPSLRELSLRYINQNPNEALKVLREAIHCGHLPNLNHLDLDHCSFNREGILRYLFGEQTPAQEHIGLEGLKLHKSDLQFISELRTLRSFSMS